MRNKFKKDNSGFSPLEILTGMAQPIVLRYLHPFSCPDFVLSADLQDHKKLPQWDERVKVGAYLGRSKKQSSNAALILDLKQATLVHSSMSCLMTTLKRLNLYGVVLSLLDGSS